MDFSIEILQARREWDDIFEELKGKTVCQPRISYPMKLSHRNEGEIRIFSDEKKRRKFITTRPVLQEMPKVLQAEINGHYQNGNI